MLIKFCLRVTVTSHTTSTDNANLNKKTFKVMKHLPSSGGRNRQHVNIYCRFCQSLGACKVNVALDGSTWGNLNSKPAAVWKRRCTSLRCGKQSWELQVSTAEKGDTVLRLFSGCSGNFMARKERILTDVEAKIVLFLGPSGRGSAFVFRVNIKNFK